MKILTRKLLYVFTAFIITLMFREDAKAQDKDAMAAIKDRTPEQRAQMQTNLMKVKLKLDSAQTTQIQAVNLKYAKKMESVLKGDGGKMAKFKEARSIAKDKDSDLKKILTNDQYKEYQALEAEMKSKIKERMADKAM